MLLLIKLSQFKFIEEQSIIDLAIVKGRVGIYIYSQKQLLKLDKSQKLKKSFIKRNKKKRLISFQI
jgi:hypothetical protein